MAVCGSALERVASSVLQCGTVVCRGMLQCVVALHFKCVIVCSSVLQCVRGHNSERTFRN